MPFTDGDSSTTTQSMAQAPRPGNYLHHTPVYTTDVEELITSHTPWKRVMLPASWLPLQAGLQGLVCFVMAGDDAVVSAH